MTRLILANVVAIIVLFRLAATCPPSVTQQLKPLRDKFPGTNCSAINYNKRCCVYGARCYMYNTVRNCSCSPNCYASENVNCCEDIHCPSGIKPKTCQDIGCCYNEKGNCRSAFLYDINGTKLPSATNCQDISNCPLTCTEAKMNPGYCLPRSNNVTCYVEQGECYCHPLCFFTDNCCEDAKQFIESWINRINPNLVQVLREIFDRDNALALDLAVQLMKIQMKDDFDALAMAIHHMNENPMVHT